MNNKLSFNIGIRAKLFILVLISFSLIIAAISWRIGEQSQQTAEDTIKLSLVQSQTILETKIQSRFDSISETAISLSRDGRVLPLVFDQESATLQDLTQEFQNALEFNIMFVLDRQGTILARSDRPGAIGRSMAGRSQLFDEALRGEKSQGYIVSQGTILQIVVVPVFDNVAHDIVRGIIALAYALSPEMANEINTLTASDVDFYIFNRNRDRKISGLSSIYSTRKDLQNELVQYFSQHEDSWRDFTSTKKKINDYSITVNNEQFRAVVYPIERFDKDNLGFILAYRSQTELLKPFLDIQRQVFIVGSIGMIIASLIAWFMARQITHPIIRLVSITEAIQNGKYPKEPSHYRKDEVGILYKALYAMSNSIREKAELESYLAGLAEDIDTETQSTQAITDIIEYKDDFEADTEDKTMLSPVPAKSSSALGNKANVNIGDVIANRYKIIKMLGKGTTGTVFLAEDQELAESIAIKILYKDYLTSDFAKMFKEEIRLARKITHRNILRTFDFGSDNGIDYITMEYVQGFDLGVLLIKKVLLTPILP